ncbi:hypothetical protein Taro_018616, partial [Colocasia esculenta]|nr:hypothetical protein [Colocasia esculenta]
MISETYDRTMADRYAEGTPQPDLDLEAWVDAVGGPRKSRVYGFGDSLDTTPVLSSYASSIAPLAYASSSIAMPDSGGDDIRTLTREELSQQLLLHLGAMVEQLVVAIRGAGTSQQAPQVMLSSYASSIAPLAYASSSIAMPDSGGDDIRTLTREELSQQLLLHLGAMVEQLVVAIRGAGTSQQAPQ